eukprot:1613318-Pyramimonas_sp.AAC.1
MLALLFGGITPRCSDVHWRPSRNARASMLRAKSNDRNNGLDQTSPSATLARSCRHGLTHPKYRATQHTSENDTLYI